MTNERWRTPPIPLARVAGLPISAATPLRCTRAAVWAERMLTLRARLVAPELEELLARAVSTTDDVGLRRRILAMRRRVHTGGRDGDAETAELLSALLTDPAATELARWAALRREYQREAAIGPELLAEDIARGRRQLRELARRPGLRAGVQLASPTLDQYLPDYLNQTGELGKRARRLERSWTSYVLRTAFKTSPFSSLTSVTIGRADAASIARLNLVPLVALMDAVLGDVTRCAELPVRLAEGVRVDGQRVRFTRRRYRDIDGLTVATGGVLEEVFVSLPDSPALRELRTITSTTPGVRAGDLALALHNSDPPGRPLDEASRYVASLLRHGLLSSPLTHIDRHAPDPVADLAQRLIDHGLPWSRRLGRRLDTITRHVAELAGADPDRRRVVLAEVRTQLDAALEDLVDPWPALDTAPRTVVYEDVVTEEPVASPAPAVLRGVHGLARILPAMDPLWVGRMQLRGYFRDTVGAGGRQPDAARFAAQFYADRYLHLLRDHYRQPLFGTSGDHLEYPNPHHLPEIGELNTARAALARRLREATPSAELVLSDDLVDEVAELLPVVEGEVEGYSFFVQLGERAGDQFGVLNWVSSGFSVPYARYAHCFDDTAVVDRLRRHLTELASPDTVFAELSSGYSMSNLSLHPPLLPYDLLCPGDTSFRPDTEQISLTELSVVDDAGSGQVVLYCPRLDVRVIPVYLDSLTPMAMSGLRRALLAFSPTSMATVDLRVPHRQGSRQPRVRHHGLTVHREQWSVAARDLAQVSDARTDAERFLSWRCWADTLGLPRQFFLSAPGEKPQYCDLDSYFCLTLIEQFARRGQHLGELTVTEVLPAREHLGVGDVRVTEHVIELDR